LPSDIASAEQALDTVEKLRTHPGRTTATGVSRMIGAQSIPGTDAYDFEALRNQAQGQLFLTAYQQLKGGGQITEVEGRKAEQSIARMDAAQSEEAFLDALRDYEAIIKIGIANSYRKAGQQVPAEFEDTDNSDPLGIR
jgi:hypothetical protein